MPESPPSLQVSDIAGITADEKSATVSPARGAEMRNFLQSRLQKNRAPPLVHSWDFWHDRQDRTHTLNQSNLTLNGNGSGIGNGDGQDGGAYEDRLEILANVDDVRKFWNVFNNFDITRLPLRDSVHLFHKGVKPVWEDARNARGGSWTFRVPKTQAPEFWRDICMLAIGEQLQQAVESERTTFRDDICGISLGVRFNSMLVQIWNRDGDHTEGVQRILSTVLESLGAEVRPREGTYYYKKHSEHAGFSGSLDSRPESTNGSSGRAEEQGMQSLNAIVDHST